MRKSTVFAGVLLALAASPVIAGRPFATEDAGVLAAGECELETYALRQTAGDAPKETGWWVQPGCGVGFRTQLAAGGGRTKVESDRFTAAALSGKTWLRELGDDRTGVTLAYSIGGAKAPGGSFEHDSTALAAVVSSPVAKHLLWHANLGWSRSQAERLTSTTWALALERTSESGLDVGAEIYGDDHEAAWLGVAARYALRPEKLFVDVSWAVQTNSARAKQLTIGLKLAF
ncbi:MAG: hypothetical protein BroJett031_21700 [Betaproteobacteria bacterium]|nr:MAG: hypothetical protein BroJett031_21700 [Betaproteobacteria bacterium]